MARKSTLLILIFLGFALSAMSQDPTTLEKDVEDIKKDVSNIRYQLEKKNKPKSKSGQTIFEDRNGRSAIFLPSGGTFRLNTADASVRLGFIHHLSNQKWFIGFDVVGKTHNGILSLVSKGDVAPGTRLTGIFGIKELFYESDILDGWTGLKVGYSGISFKLFDPTATFASQVQRRSFNTLTLDWAFNVKIGGNKLAGLAAGWEMGNNYNDLSSTELTDVTVILDSATNTTRSYSTTTRARMGTFESFSTVPVKADFFWTPNDNPRVGFYHYWRGRLRSGEFRNGFGSGIYLLKKNNPLATIAGIVLDVKDVSKFSEGIGNNFAINLIVGFNFDVAR